MDTSELIRFLRPGHTIRQELSAERRARKWATVRKHVARVYAFLMGYLVTITIIQVRELLRPPSCVR